MKQNSLNHPAPICDELCSSLLREGRDGASDIRGESETRNKKQETRNKKQETRNKKQEIINELAPASFD